LYLAKSSSFNDLGSAVAAAAANSAVSAISNSYGGGGNTAGTSYPKFSAAALTGQGIAVTASSGDNGYRNSDPADFTNVIGVGGTTLASVSSGVGQSIWSGAGSGCSTNNVAPYQNSAVTLCKSSTKVQKAVSDVSAVANPNTGVAVRYANSYLQFGGTSVSAPIVATYFAMTNIIWRAFSATVGVSKAAAWLWSLPQNPAFYDPLDGGTNLTRGSCNPSLWCHTKSGWDGPTGLGTPRPGVAGAVF
jgi:subtilase family serine protease